MLRRSGSMRGLLPALLSVLFAGLAAAASSDLFDNQLGDINYCKKQCQLTIKNKSPAKDSIMNACHRGCRLYSICQFVNGDAGFNTSKEECQGGESLWRSVHWTVFEFGFSKLNNFTDLHH
ncbi:hypothetical protein AMECASPLE_020683 [Ameca splendens]|uniref:Uncharacterized protein n=1 Tax=Ameca splendens TaxID=208324 RepID=A0ABV0YRK7_9TELE